MAAAAQLSSAGACWVRNQQATCSSSSSSSSAFASASDAVQFFSAQQQCHQLSSTSGKKALETSLKLDSLGRRCLRAFKKRGGGVCIGVAVNSGAVGAGLPQKNSIDENRPRSNLNPSSVGRPRLAVTTAAVTATAVAAPQQQEYGSGGQTEEKSGSQGSTTIIDELEDNNRRTDNPFNVIFVSSEVAPYSKTGGLGDVCGSLPIALAARGHRVMVVSPRYQNGVSDHLFESAFDAQTRVKVQCFGGLHEVAYFHEYREGVDWVFVDHPSYHRAGTPYGDTRGAFGDNQFRFTLLCHAACEAPLQLALGGIVYGDKCLFVANDWHASLVPVLLAAKYRRNKVFLGSRCILAIHNLAHQGVEPGTTYGNLGLPSDWYGALEWVFPEWARLHALDKGEAVNHMKGAVVTSDRILTVSEGYAWEITTQEGGCGLDGLLKSRNAVINGITNGVDENEWNPTADKHLPSQYSIDDLGGKAECKAALQKELGFEVRPEVPLIGFIGRLDYQKGPDLIQAALPELMSDDIQLVMLGSGDPDYEKWMAWAELTHKEKFRGWVGFSVPVAHRITAGCDILLMPSRFEPCGLNQLYAMKYGTVPVAHCTGGLRDTIENYDPLANDGEGAGAGWTFSPLSKEAMMESLWTAVNTYRDDKIVWEGLMRRGMSQDFSWERAALQYEQVFEWAMIDPPYA